MYYRVKQDASGGWYWLLYAANNEVISRSSESYVRKSSAEYGITLNKSSSQAPVFDG